MEKSTNLSKVVEALTTAMPDCPFTTQGKVTEVKRVRGSCYFSLADGDARLACALLRREAAQTAFWVTVGQVVEVTGYPECFRGRWQLRLVDVRLVSGAKGWPVGYRTRSARRVVDSINRLMEMLFGPMKD